MLEEENQTIIESPESIEAKKAYSFVVRMQEMINQEIAKPYDISIINLVDWMIIHAYKMRASDIHISPSGKDLEIKYTRGFLF